MAALQNINPDIAREYIQANTEINVVRGNVPYSLPGQTDYDGTISLDFIGASLFKSRIHTWADADKGKDGMGTLQEGTMTGRLILRTNANKGNYLNAIGLFNNGVSCNDGVLMHPDAFNALGNTESYTGAPGSEACLIMGLNDFNGLTRAIKGLGYHYRDTTKPGTYDEISVNLSISSGLKNWASGLPENNRFKKHIFGDYTPGD